MYASACVAVLGSAGEIQSVKKVNLGGVVNDRVGGN